MAEATWPSWVIAGHTQWTSIEGDAPRRRHCDIPVASFVNLQLARAFATARTESSDIRDASVKRIHAAIVVLSGDRTVQRLLFSARRQPRGQFGFRGGRA